LLQDNDLHFQSRLALFLLNKIANAFHGMASRNAMN
jgi:hypothetical protein